MSKGFSSWTSARRRRCTRAHKIYRRLAWLSYSRGSLLNKLLWSDGLPTGRCASDCGHSRLPWYGPGNGVVIGLIPILARFGAASVAICLSRLGSRALFSDRARSPGRTRLVGLIGQKFWSIAYCWTKVKCRNCRAQFIGCPRIARVAIFISAYGTHNACSRLFKRLLRFRRWLRTCILR
jgi:hypothetical protein